ncbi:MAG: IS200/IS605 family transposase [Limnoraphis robusta]|jgi:putative transposase|uniref:Transposase n=3 Tax=Oscillatoriales TaxID=1150 RepID=A0A0F5YHU8_9CYAN|nr:IS200/IS605 family transposase [Limnoraphis robusta]KKD38217.1 transposase [Limnoraphis robusta CS-951]MEA5499206.1 IS200/IS605 family transposase [Limnoraphis robusta BA-68 BA1]MEA5522372.1 IS200/IS605 family transposase [Limnoraphis robusta CCNP1315]MEA5540673.1 IS200/IS605 family transposase [Limnoraphis robusta Tam1]MEA5545045.1 IS200/IS605 family transposase [Limnoraphis robusta CCNP1324]
MEFKSNNNIVYNCQYHVVWCVKYRRKVLIGDVEARLKEILAQVVVDVRCELYEMETDKDHVHLLISCDPQFGIHRVVKRMKGRSSKLLRDEFPALKSRIPTLWTNSYFVATVGGAPLAVIKQYIKDQQLV